MENGVHLLNDVRYNSEVHSTELITFIFFLPADDFLIIYRTAKIINKSINKNK